MSRSMTWGQLLKVCAEHGKDKVLPALEAYHERIESFQAHIYGGDHAEVRQAQRMAPIIEKQAITLGRLKRMSDDEIRAAVARPTSSAGVSSSPGKAPAQEAA
jgi:hypothetical protein